MTGSEIAAVGAAAKGAAEIGKALQGDDKENSALIEGAKGATGFHVAADARADRMAMKQLAINRLLAPLFWFAGYRRDYFEGGQFAGDLADKLADVPEEEIVAPSSVIAAGAMEGLSYSLDEPDLKEMYLNLLATASHRKRKDGAHPSYAEVIKQLSGSEAPLLVSALARHQSPLVSVESHAEPEARGFTTLERHVPDLTDPDTGYPVELAQWPIFVDNWVRLGLVAVQSDAWLTADGIYDFAESRPEFVRHHKAGSADRSLKIQKGLMTATDFGLGFLRAVTDSLSGITHTKSDSSGL